MCNFSLCVSYVMSAYYFWQAGACLTCLACLVTLACLLSLACLKLGLFNKFGLSNKLVEELALLAWSPWVGSSGHLEPLGSLHEFHWVGSLGPLGPMHHSHHCGVSCLETRIGGQFSWNIERVENGNL